MLGRLARPADRRSEGHERDRRTDRRRAWWDVISLRAGHGNALPSGIASQRGRRVGCDCPVGGTDGSSDRAVAGKHCGVRVFSVAVAVGCVFLAACGPLDRAELSRGVETLSALAAEGQLVADGVASDRSKATYTRVHARALADDAAHEAEKLADAGVQTGIERERDQAVALAQQLDDTLGELETFPGGERTGRQVHGDLMGIADGLDRLTS